MFGSRDVLGGKENVFVVIAEEVHAGCKVARWKDRSTLIPQKESSCEFVGPFFPYSRRKLDL
jgi:hypothetical protein